MNVAIIGTGNVARALGGRLMQAGIPVTFGLRNPGAAPKGELPPGARTASLPDAAVSADVVVLAVPAADLLAAAAAAGPLTGKVVIDCTNPLRFDRGPVWAPPAEGSAAQALATAVPGTRVVKGFNHFGAEIHGNPVVQGSPADALFAGDDAEAKAVAMQLAERIGFRGIDAGPLRNAGALEQLAVLWIQLSLSGTLGRHFAFTLRGRD